MGEYLRHSLRKPYDDQPHETNIKKYYRDIQKLNSGLFIIYLSLLEKLEHIKSQLKNTLKIVL